MAGPTILADGLLAAAGAFIGRAICAISSMIMFEVAVRVAISWIKERWRGGEPEREVVSMEAARQLARSGMRLQAVKMIRDVSGPSMSIREALEIVKRMESERGPEL